MTLEVIDTLTGTGQLGALDPREALAARNLLHKVSKLPAKSRLLVARELDKCGPPPADLEGLSGWWADAKKKAGKALKKVGAAKILAAATGGIPLIGPLVGPLVSKAVSAQEKRSKGDNAGADREVAEIRQAAQAGAAAVQEIAPIPGQATKPVNWMLIGGLAAGALVAVKLLGGRR